MSTIYIGSTAAIQNTAHYLDAADKGGQMKVYKSGVRTLRLHDCLHLNNMK